MRKMIFDLLSKKWGYESKRISKMPSCLRRGTVMLWLTGVIYEGCLAKYGSVEFFGTIRATENEPNLEDRLKILLYLNLSDAGKRAIF